MANGARYVASISVDAGAQTVTLVGQGDASATVTWAELHIDQPFAAAVDAAAQP